MSSGLVCIPLADMSKCAEAMHLTSYIHYLDRPVLVQMINASHHTRRRGLTGLWVNTITCTLLLYSCVLIRHVTTGQFRDLDLA